VSSNLTLSAFRYFILERSDNGIPPLLKSGVRKDMRVRISPSPQLAEFGKYPYLVCISMIDTIIASVALLMSGFMMMRDYLLPAKLKMFFGDSLQIIYGDRNKIQVNWNLTNSRNKLLVVNKLEAFLVSPDGNKYTYTRNIFYRLEGNSAVPDRIPTSIAVLARSSVFQGIEFISNERFIWSKGIYVFYVRAWVNRSIRQKSNLLTKIIFSLNKDDIDYFNGNSALKVINTMRPVKIIS
jgi:hypothetical protein